jgi:glycosyltransferase involved in cell wall biosynthesis
MARLLILGPSLKLYGGVSNYIRLLDKQIDKEKFEIKYLVIGKSESFWKNVFYPLLILIQFVKLKKILKDFRPELIHLNPSLNTIAIFRDFLFLKSIKKEGFPVLLFIHGWQENIGKKFHSIFWKHYFRTRLEMANAIVILANKFKKDLVELGINANKIYVSSTMVESEKFTSLYRTFDPPYTLLFCSRIEKSKGVFQLLDASPKILNLFPRSTFIFIGGGKDLKKLKKKSKELGIENRVLFTGYISEEKKKMIFKTSHLFIFPSYHGEGFPTVILEAMAAGMPIITTPIAGLADAIENSREGLLLNNIPSAIEIDNKIIQLLEAPGKMQKMSEYNISKIKEKYDVEIVSKKIFDIYDDLLSNCFNNISVRRKGGILKRITKSKI